MWKEMWQNYLSWSASERLGILALILLTLTCAIVDRTLPVWVSNRAINRFEALEKEYLASLEAERNQEDSGVVTFNRSDKVSIPVDIARKTPPKRVEASSGKYNSRSPKPHFSGPLSLNTCTLDNLLRSGRIERKFCYRLIRFREQAGGFYDVKQVRDIYEMTDSIFQKLVPHLVLDTVPLKTINVNGLSAESLAGHPYISPGLARQIVGFREKVRPFESRIDLLQLYFMNEELLGKLEPYVAYQ